MLQLLSSPPCPVEKGKENYETTATWRFKLTRHGEKKRNFKGKKDSCHEGMSASRVIC